MGGAPSPGGECRNHRSIYQLDTLLMFSIVITLVDMQLNSSYRYIVTSNRVRLKFLYL